MSSRVEEWRSEGRERRGLNRALSTSSTTGLVRGNDGGEMRRRHHWKTVPVTVVLPDCSAYFMELREDCRGYDCLAKMCDVLGVVEIDYFGLKYTDYLAGCEAWVNNRLNLRRQLKRSRQPYRLAFRVKFFTEAHLLQQPSTKQAFYRDLKHRIQRGKLTVSKDLRPIIGALTAQVELGNYSESQPRSQALVYPPYFPDWSEGIAYQISREHKKLTGLSKQEMIEKYLDKVCDLECGVNSYRGYFDDRPVSVNLGSRNIHIIGSNNTTIYKIAYYSMTQVSFGSQFFGLQFHYREEDGSSVDKKIRVAVRNKYVARHMFREATEQQVFFYQATVLPEVRNHADAHTRRFRRFCKSVLLGRERDEKEYYFDIVRTKHEVYSHSWQLLHQVEGEREGEQRGGGGEGERGGDGRGGSTLATVTIESDDSSSQIDTVDSNKVYWGLSTSSYNLAKDLLAEPHLQTCDSETPLLISSSSTSRTSPLPSRTLSPQTSSSFTDGCTAKTLLISRRSSATANPSRLNHTQSKKLRQLLLTIQDERLCQVCMSSRISAVFCPCGHHVSCYRCAKKLVKCPICRQPIGYVQYVYTH